MFCNKIGEKSVSSAKRKNTKNSQGLFSVLKRRKFCPRTLVQKTVERFDDWYYVQLAKWLWDVEPCYSRVKWTWHVHRCACNNFSLKRFFYIVYDGWGMNGWGHLSCETNFLQTLLTILYTRFTTLILFYVISRRIAMPILVPRMINPRVYSIEDWIRNIPRIHHPTVPWK